MAFTDIIKSMPNQREETIKKLAELTSSSTVSVYRWINGQVIPPLVKQKIIADYLNLPIEELFPKIDPK